MDNYSLLSSSTFGFVRFLSVCLETSEIEVISLHKIQTLIQVQMHLTLLTRQYWLFVLYFVGCQLRIVALSKSIRLEIKITLILANNNEFQRLCTSHLHNNLWSFFRWVQIDFLSRLIIPSFVTKKTMCML